MGMERRDILYCIDMGMLIAFLLCGVTGIIKWPGLVNALGLDYRALPMGAFTVVHDWSGLVFCALSLVHVGMHRKWLIAMTRAKMRMRR